LQLCGQALCLEEMFGCDVPEGDLFYGTTRRRVTVPFTPELRARTLAAADAVRVLLAQSALPAPVADARCPRCSLVETCMPGIVARLSSTDDA
jgi:CRISPR-associated exonuclease Cas4